MKMLKSKMEEQEAKISKMDEHMRDMTANKSEQNTKVAEVLKVLLDGDAARGRGCAGRRQDAEK